MAKLYAGDAAVKVATDALQLFGGYGYMNEYPIARMYRDARVQRIYGGTNEIMKLLISRSL
jgi:acyl-CoA dehydrogenase